MAIWFCLIFAAFVFIWAVTGELGSLTSETFIMLGISAGTALGSIAVDQTKASPAATVEAQLGAIGLQTARDVEKLRRLIRSDERRVGKECGSTCSSRWSPDHLKTKERSSIKVESAT